MSDIHVAKPEANIEHNIPSSASSKYVLDFDLSQATLSKENQNLLIGFDDGSKIRLENFYTEHTSEKLPLFNVQGEDITAEDFFTRVEEPDLMPAAGPAASAARNARFREFGTSDLLDGIDHMGALDYSSQYPAVESAEHENVQALADSEIEETASNSSAQIRNSEIARPESPEINRPVTPPSGSQPDVNPPVAPEIPETVQPVAPEPPAPANPIRPEPVAPPSSNDPQTPGEPVNPNVPDTPDTPPSSPEIGIKPDNPAIIDPLPDIPGIPVADKAVLAFNEKDLRDGGSLEQSGKITISADCAVDHIAIGDVVIWQDGQLVNTRIDRDGGYLEITSFDPDTGELSFRFVLEEATQEHKEQGEDLLDLEFNVSVTDENGKTVEAPIIINIVDDVPEANADFAKVVEGAAIYGNVVTGAGPDDAADEYGADGAGKFNSSGIFASEGAIVVNWADVPSSAQRESDARGDYYLVEREEGAIKLYDDGSYEFSANGEIPGLIPGTAPHVLQFGYSIVDADGDVAESVLTITIAAKPNGITITPDNPGEVDPEPGKPGAPDNPDDPDKPENLDKPDDKPGDPDDPDNPLVPNPGVGVAQSVLNFDEKDLREQDSVVRADSMTVVAKDGVARIEVGGRTVWQDGSLAFEADRTFATDEGELLITGFDEASGKFSYEYTLTGASHEHSRQGADSIAHTFQVTVTSKSSGDNQAASYIAIIVKDDAPEAYEDNASVMEGESVEGNVVTASGDGDAADVYGADNAGAFNEKGEFVQDGAIAVKWDVPSDFQRQTDANGNGYYKITVPEGVATLYDDGSYAFEAGSNIENLIPGSAPRHIQFGYSIADADGDIAESVLTITVNAKPNGITITPDNPKEVDPESEKPDTPDTPDDPDDPDKPETPDKPIDKSGDPDDPYNPLVPNPGLGVPQSALSFDEKALRDQPSITQKDSMTVKSEAGVARIELGGKVVWENGELAGESDRTFATDEGILLVTGFDQASGKLTYEYTLTGSSLEHGYQGPDSIVHTFQVKATAAGRTEDGEPAQAASYIAIIVKDDTPEAYADYATVKEGDTVDGNVVTATGEGDNADLQGADSFGAFNEKGEFDPDGAIAVRWDVPIGSERQTDANDNGFYRVSIAEGEARLYDNGNYEFSAKEDIDNLYENSEARTVEFKYAIVDRDGDIAESSLTINVQPGPDRPIDKPGPEDPDNPLVPNPGPGIDQSVLHFDEKDLRGGETVTESDSMTVTNPQAADVIEVGRKVVWENGFLKPLEERTIATDEGFLTVTGFNQETGKLEYEYTLERPTQEHGRPGADSISHTFQVDVRVTDLEGKSASSYIAIIIKDDVPEASPTSDALNEGETVSGSIFGVDAEGNARQEYGADQEGRFNGEGHFDQNGEIAVRWDVPEGTVHRLDASGSGYFRVSNEQGTAILYDDGRYEFTANDDIPGLKSGDPAQSVKFGYAIVDSDGDVAESILDITVNANDDLDGPGIAKLTLITSDQIIEGEKIEITAQLDKAGESDIVVKLSNGQTITIPGGETSATITIDSRENEHLVQGNLPTEISIADVSGGEQFEQLNVDRSIQTTFVNDDKDPTKLALSADASVVEGSTITLTATLEKASDEDLNIRLDDSHIITIKAGELSGATEFETRPQDHLVQGEQTLTFEIKDIIGADRFENLVTGDPVTVKVTDKPVDPDNPDTPKPGEEDVTNLTLITSDQIIEGEQIEITAQLDKAGESDLVVKLSNGKPITIPGGETSATITIDSRENEHLVQGNLPTEISIADVSGGEQFEQLNVDRSIQTTFVNDDKDVTRVILSTSGTVKEGGAITVTASLVQESGKPFQPSDQPLTVTLASGQTITINAYDDSASIPLEASEWKDMQKDGVIALKIDSVTGGERFEKLDVDSTAHITQILENKITAYERNLAQGSSPDEKALEVVETIDIGKEGNVKSVTLGGKSLDDNVETVIDLPNNLAGSGELVATYHADSGKIECVFRLEKTLTHPDRSGVDSIADSLELTVSRNGITETSSLKLEVVDDVPFILDQIAVENPENIRAIRIGDNTILLAADAKKTAIDVDLDGDGSADGVLTAWLDNGSLNYNFSPNYQSEKTGEAQDGAAGQQFEIVIERADGEQQLAGRINIGGDGSLSTATGADAEFVNANLLGSVEVGAGGYGNLDNFLHKLNFGADDGPDKIITVSIEVAGKDEDGKPVISIEERKFTDDGTFFIETSRGTLSYADGKWTYDTREKAPRINVDQDHRVDGKLVFDRMDEAVAQFDVDMQNYCGEDKFVFKVYDADGDVTEAYFSINVTDPREVIKIAADEKAGKDNNWNPPIGYEADVTSWMKGEDLEISWGDYPTIKITEGAYQAGETVYTSHYIYNMAGKTLKSLTVGTVELVKDCQPCDGVILEGGVLRGQADIDLNGDKQMDGILSASFDSATSVVTIGLTLNEKSISHLDVDGVLKYYNNTLVDYADGTHDYTYMFRIFVQDDKPYVTPEFNHFIDNNASVSAPIDGNALYNARGSADGAEFGWDLTGVDADRITQDGENYIVKAQYGTITLNKDGSYHYVLDKNNADVKSLTVLDDLLTESFTYRYAETAESGHNDVASGTVNIKIGHQMVAPKPGPSESEGGEDYWGSGEVMLFDRPVTIPEGFVCVAARSGNYGRMAFDSSGGAHYFLQRPMDSSVMDENGELINDGRNVVEGADQVVLLLYNVAGNYYWSYKAPVAIKDDVPFMEVHMPASTEEFGYHADPGSLVKGDFPIDFGADARRLNLYANEEMNEEQLLAQGILRYTYGHGPESLLVSVNGKEEKSYTPDPVVGRNDTYRAYVDVPGEHGTLRIYLNKNTFEYRPDAEKPGQDVFTFGLRDMDGDIISQNADGSAPMLVFWVEKPGDGGDVIPPEFPDHGDLDSEQIPSYLVVGGTWVGRDFSQEDPGPDSTGATMPDIDEIYSQPGKYGILKIGANGQFLYCADPLKNGNSGGRDVIEYINEDGETVKLAFYVYKPAASTLGATASEAAVKTSLDDLSGLPEGFHVAGIMANGGSHGHIELTADGGLVYILDKPLNSTIETNQTDSVPVMVEDEHGNQQVALLRVEIRDSAPVISDERDADADNGAFASGHLVYDYGADREPYRDDKGNILEIKDADGNALEVMALKALPESLGREAHSILSGDRIEGKFGLLEIDAEGRYSYYLYQDSVYNSGDLNAAQDAVMERFDVVITDADGTMTTLNLDFDIKLQDNRSLHRLTESAEFATSNLGVINERNLLAASANPDGAVDIAGLEIAHSHSYRGTYGKIIHEDGGWRYVLDRPVDHSVLDGEIAKDTVRINALDAEGNGYEVEVKIDILDSEPNPAVLKEGVRLVNAGEVDTVSDSFFLDYGADNWDGKQTRITLHFRNENGEPDSKDISLNSKKVVKSQFGEIWLNGYDENNHYSIIYTADASDEDWPDGMVLGLDEFFFQIEDADGDVVGGFGDNDHKITFAVLSDNPGSVSVEPVKVCEKSAVHNVDTQIGFENIPRDWSLEAGEYKGALGNIVVKEDGSCSYGLEGPIDFDGPGSARDSATVTIKNSRGEIKEVDLPIDIIGNSHIAQISQENIPEGWSLIADEYKGSYGNIVVKDGKCFYEVGKAFESGFIPSDGETDPLIDTDTVLVRISNGQEIRQYALKVDITDSTPSHSYPNYHNDVSSFSVSYMEGKEYQLEFDYGADSGKYEGVKGGKAHVEGAHLEIMRKKWGNWDNNNIAVACRPEDGEDSADAQARIEGDFGWLVMDANGHYHYEFKSGVIEVKEEAINGTLNPASTVADQFRISIYDADGDKANTDIVLNMQIRLEDLPPNTLLCDGAGSAPLYFRLHDPSAEEYIVQEQPVGTEHGSGSLDMLHAMIAAGWKLMPGADGNQAELEDGLVEIAGDKGYGNLIYDGESFVYRLNGSVEHPANQDVVNDTVKFTVWDGEHKNTAYTVSLKIGIADTAPTLTNIYEGEDYGYYALELSAAGAASGKMLADFGADDKNYGGKDVLAFRVQSQPCQGEDASRPVGDIGLDPEAAPTVIRGYLGSLTVNPDGSYQYQLGGELRAVEWSDVMMPSKGRSANTGSLADAEFLYDTFRFTAVDADGDAATRDVVIKIDIHAVNPFTSVGGERLDMALGAFEAGINASEASLVPGDSLNIVDLSNLDLEIKAGEYKGRHGSVVMEDGQWIYRLNGALDSRVAGSDGDTVKIVVKYGPDGKYEREVDLAVKIADTAPQFENIDEHLAVDESGYVEGSLGLSFGADITDNAATYKGSEILEAKSLPLDNADREGALRAVGAEGLAIAGKCGILTIQHDGEYKYELYENGSLIAASDIVGGSAVDRFYFRATDADGDSVARELSFEIDLETHTKFIEGAPPEIDSIIVHENGLVLADGSNAAAVELVGEDWTIAEGNHQGTHGEISFSDGKWIYTLNGAVDHGNADSLTDIVSVPVVNKDGVVATVNVAVNIADSKSWLDFGNYDADGAPLPAIFDFQNECRGSFKYSYGADNWQGADSKLGLYVYTLDEAGNVKDELNITSSSHGDKWIAGKDGKLTFTTNPDGVVYFYVPRQLSDDDYTLPPGAIIRGDEFYFKIVDADGDASSEMREACKLAIKLENPGESPAAVKVSESGVKDANDSDESHVALIEAANIPEGWELVAGEYMGRYGNVADNGDGTCSYKLHGAFKSEFRPEAGKTDPGFDTDEILVNISKDGVVSQFLLKVDITDSAPACVRTDFSDSGTIRTDKFDYKAGAVGRLGFDYGADSGAYENTLVGSEHKIEGAHLEIAYIMARPGLSNYGAAELARRPEEGEDPDACGARVKSKYGTLVMDVDGNYRYELNQTDKFELVNDQLTNWTSGYDKAYVTEQYKVEVYDADGDSVSKYLDVKIYLNDMTANFFVKAPGYAEAQPVYFLLHGDEFNPKNLSIKVDEQTPRAEDGFDYGSAGILADTLASSLAEAGWHIWFPDKGGEIKGDNEYGRVVYDADRGGYFYKLYEGVNHGGEKSVKDTVKIRLWDGEHENVYRDITIPVEIIDSSPRLVIEDEHGTVIDSDDHKSGTITLIESTAEPILKTAGALNFDKGADIPKDGNSLEIAAIRYNIAGITDPKGKELYDNNFAYQKIEAEIATHGCAVIDGIFGSLKIFEDYTYEYDVDVHKLKYFCQDGKNLGLYGTQASPYIHYDTFMLKMNDADGAPVMQELKFSVDRDTAKSKILPSVTSLYERKDDFTGLDQEKGNELLGDTNSSRKSDAIFARGGDDYIDGKTNQDAIFAGMGNDVIRYDPIDAVIDGESGIDLIITNDTSLSLAKLLAGNGTVDGRAAPVVKNVEMLLKMTEGVEKKLDIASQGKTDVRMGMANVAAACGFLLNDNGDIFLDADKWQLAEEQVPGQTTVSFESKSEGKNMVLEIQQPNDETRHHIYLKQSGTDADDILNADEYASILNGLDGEDLLFGGLGDDRLFGGSGDDYLSGGDGADWLYGEDGDDLILLGKNDLLIDGGDGVDIILAQTSEGEQTPTLHEMLINGDEKGDGFNKSTDRMPMVRNVDALVSGNVEKLFTMDDLKEKGIGHGVDEDGGNILRLSAEWQPEQTGADDAADIPHRTTTWHFHDADSMLHLETTLDVEWEGSIDDAALVNFISQLPDTEIQEISGVKSEEQQAEVEPQQQSTAVDQESADQNDEPAENRDDAWDGTGQHDAAEAATGENHLLIGESEPGEEAQINDIEPVKNQEAVIAPEPVKTLTEDGNRDDESAMSEEVNALNADLSDAKALYIAVTDDVDAEGVSSGKSTEEKTDNVRQTVTETRDEASDRTKTSVEKTAAASENASDMHTDALSIVNNEFASITNSQITADQIAAETGGIL